MTWPPVHDACDARDLVTRLQWHLPRIGIKVVHICVDAHLSIPVTFWSEGTEILDLPPREKARVEIVSDRRSQSTLLQSSCGVLIWKMIDRAHIAALAHLGRWFVIDPDWFSRFEELEWTTLYNAFKDPDIEACLQEISRRNLRKLRDAGKLASVINVCGNGPHIRKLLDRPPDYSLNIICNTAVQSPELIGRLRPAAIAFANSVFFGPSEFARKIIAAAQRCVYDYGAVIVVPSGYAQHLITSNYPALAEHTLGLNFGTELNIPDEERLEVNGSTNVATSLMLPLAAALGRKQIHIWGCDGDLTKQRSRWSPWAYFAGGEPARDSATRVHPAFFRDRVIDEQYYRKYMQDHNHYFETLLRFFEVSGLEVQNHTPSTIPALKQRLI